MESLFEAHRAPTYARLARAFAEDPPAVQAHASGRALPLIVLHAVRWAALQGRAHDPWSADPDAVRQDIVRLHGEVDAALRRGLVQYTEPQRMADLLPGLLLASGRYPERPARLIELGACAGLLLAPERYRIRYPRGEWSTEKSVIELTSELDLPPGLLDPDLSDASALPIVDRVGIDLAPVDPATGYDYLRSFTWPGSPAREARLREALDAVAVDPAPVIAGNALDVLPELLTDERGLLTIVVDSAVSRYLSGPQAVRLGQLLDAAGQRGPTVLISRARAGRSTVTSGATSQALHSRVVVVDLTARWRSAYAATDALSERAEWIGRTAATAASAALG